MPPDSLRLNQSLSGWERKLVKITIMTMTISMSIIEM
jgi:hypothetical protein